MARQDLNALCGILLPFAQEMLANHGAFYPFGATMNAKGELGQTAAYTGEENPDCTELVELLTGGFRAQAEKKEVRAVGICLDVRTMAPGETEKTDAICARLRHSDHESIDVFVPYRKDASGAVTYGKLFATQGDNDVFV